MRLPGISCLTLFLCFLAIASEASAGLIAAPGTLKVDNLSTTPKWLKEGKGDDGYVRVTARISMPDASCKNLGRAGLFGIGSESIQIVASVKSSGFGNTLEGRTLPLATFDSRTNPGECNGLNTMPLTIIPMARLEKYSAGSPGQLMMLFEVKSTSSADVNLVATAQFALGTAAVFATGGAAATVVGLSAKLSEPALKVLENKVNDEKSRVLSGQAGTTFTWARLREGVGSITVPVYGGKASKNKESKTIEDLKKSADPNARLFDILLEFSYHRSLFDSMDGTNDVPQEENVTRSRILSYPNWDQKADGITLLQLLNGTSPSLLQQAANTQYVREWTDVCDQTLGKLRNAGLNQLDRAIVLKAFLDEAKEGADWYSPPNVDACLNNLSSVKADMLRVFGPLGPIFTVRDTMAGTGEAFKKWKYAAPATLSQFRQAMTMNEAKVELLSALSSADLKVQFWPDSTEWLAGHENPPGSGVARLAVKAIKRAGCFVYADNSDLDNVTGYGGHMILLGNNDDLWHAQVRMAPNDPRKISLVHLSRLDEEWKSHFKRQTYNGGDCPAILKNL